MYQRNKKPYGGLETVKINVGLILGEEKDEDAFIVMKEPKVEMSLIIKREKGTDSTASLFLNMLDDLIIDHNLMETETEKMTNKDVAELARSKTKLGLHLLTEYTKALFRFLPSKKDEK